MCPIQFRVDANDGSPSLMDYGTSAGWSINSPELDELLCRGSRSRPVLRQLGLGHRRPGTAGSRAAHSIESSRLVSVPLPRGAVRDLALERLDDRAR